MQTLESALHSAGLDALLPTLLALHALASAIDALIPQPATGSHWLPLRKLLSLAAGNVHYASNGQQPSLLTWVQRIVALLPPAVAPAPPSVPPAPVTQAPVQVAPPAVRVEPTLPATPIANPGTPVPGIPAFPFPAQPAAPPQS